MSGYAYTAADTYASENNIPFTFSDEAPYSVNFINTLTISSESVLTGENITINASSTGGTAPYKYSVIYKLTSSSDWTVIQDYFDNDIITITPEIAVTYDVCVKSKDENSTEVKKFFTVTLVKKTLITLLTCWLHQ